MQQRASATGPAVGGALLEMHWLLPVQLLRGRYGAATATAWCRRRIRPSGIGWDGWRVHDPSQAEGSNGAGLSAGRTRSSSSRSSSACLASCWPLSSFDLGTWQ